MSYYNVLDKYPFQINTSNFKQDIDKIVSEKDKFSTDKDVLKQIFNCIDLTTLKETDSADSVTSFVQKVNDFSVKFPSMPSVGGICVYPVFTPIVNQYLKVNTVKKAVVSGGFPSSQTFMDIKILETKKAVSFGANEVDVVISVGEFLEGNYEFVYEEICQLKEACGNAHLKVILETGAIKDPQLIWNASIIAMEAGADFIKTSTGKIAVAATLEAAYIMCSAIKAYEKETKRKVGFKAAGGISTTLESVQYYAIITSVLGEEWLNNSLFRIGASRLANNLLSDIMKVENSNNEEIKYF